MIRPLALVVLLILTGCGAMPKNPTCQTVDVTYHREGTKFDATVTCNGTVEMSDPISLGDFF